MLMVVGPSGKGVAIGGLKQAVAFRHVSKVKPPHASVKAAEDKAINLVYGVANVIHLHTRGAYCTMQKSRYRSSMVLNVETPSLHFAAYLAIGEQNHCLERHIIVETAAKVAPADNREIMAVPALGHGDIRCGRHT